MLITGDATEIYIDFTNGTKLELGPASEVLLDQSVYRLQAFGDADVIADVVALQQSILDGVTDLADLESTEAGVGQLGSAASLESIPLYAREGRVGAVDSRPTDFDAGATLAPDDASDSTTTPVSQTASTGAGESASTSTSDSATAPAGSGDSGPPLGGSFDGAVTEENVGDAPETATGALTGPTFADVAATVGVNGLGSFQLVGGRWTYTLDQTAVQNLGAGDVVNNSITFTADDSTTQVMSVSVTGTDDASIISGTVTGAVLEGDVGDAPVTATGTIVLTDVDADDTPVFVDATPVAGDNALGSFSIVGGVWTFVLDQSGVQDLDAGDVVNDTQSFTASDGSTLQFTVTVTGTADAAVITGTVAGAVLEGNLGDAPVTAAGALAITDADADDSPGFADVVSTVGDNSFGSFVLTGGAWTYTLNQSTVQDQDAGDVMGDTIMFTADDGSTQLVTVSITGTDGINLAVGFDTKYVIVRITDVFEQRRAQRILNERLRGDA